MLYNKIYFILFIIFIGCANDTSINIIDDDNESSLLEYNLDFQGNDNTLDIITWNIENYPKHNLTNIYLTEIIDSLNVDIIALQEITSINALNELANTLDNWDAYCGPNHCGQRNGFLINNNTIEYDAPYEILTSIDDEPFTKFPLVLEFDFNNHDYIIINNHFKCCGDGTININDDYDEEYRRFYSIELIKEYIDNNLSMHRVILLGDLNDELIDTENVFQSLLDDSENYHFTDLNIAANSDEYWSFPSWPSHIDHICITNELFSNHQHTQTILIDQFLSNGFSEYEQYISDHRPVVIQLNMQP